MLNYTENGAENIPCEKLNQIIQMSVPEDLKQLTVLEEKHLGLADYQAHYTGSDAKRLPKYFSADMRSFCIQEFRSHLQKDFNKNKKPDLAIICVPPSRKSTYLVILEKDPETNNYNYVTNFKFDFFKIFISGLNKHVRSNKIVLYYQKYKPKREVVSWNGSKYTKR